MYKIKLYAFSWHLIYKLNRGVLPHFCPSQKRHIEELRPIQAGEQQRPSAVFYSATVVGKEALGEDIQQLLQTIVSEEECYSKR